MDDLDQLFRALANAQAGMGTVIACLYTGSDFPEFCCPMPRDPVPPTGAELDDGFHLHITAAVNINSSVHDGAIMVGRETEGSPYRITGWSFRLFAPDSGHSLPPNRGSAFNSCFATAQTDRVDRVYLYSAGQMHVFSAGNHSVL